MRPSKTMMFILAAALVTPLAAFSDARAADGKTLFSDKKCTTCHSVKAAGIEKTKKKKGPDLSGVGKTMSADEIAKFAKKETEKKSVYSDKKVKHKKKFKGSDEDLKAIAAFLAAQKSDLKVADEGGEDDSDDDKE